MLAMRRAHSDPRGVKWGSPSREPGRSGPMRGGHISQLRAAILCLCAMVVVSGLLYSPALRSGERRQEGSLEELDGSLGGVALKMLSRLRQGGAAQGGEAGSGDPLNSILSERDAFFRRPRVPAPSPPPPAPKKKILAVTPTYARAFQELYMTRLTAMVRAVGPPFLWIVVESPHKTEETASLLNRTAGLCLPLGRPNCRTIDYVHIETGEVERAKMNKAVVHRNRGLDYIEDERLEGVIYFMDDDNSYAPQLFEELRKIRWIGAMPVGFLYTQEYSRRNPHLHNTPIVERPLVTPAEGSGEMQVFGWETFEWFIPKPGQKERIFNIDMAGFGFSSEALWAQPNEHGYPRKPVRFEPTHMGFLEDNFLLKLIHSATELEPLADGCTDVWVWHVHMEQESKYVYPGGWYIEQPSDLVPIEKDDDSKWPFVINKTKHGVRGKGEKGGQFIYE